jgi:hypothetical protein
MATARLSASGMEPLQHRLQRLDFLRIRIAMVVKVIVEVLGKRLLFFI